MIRYTVLSLVFALTLVTGVSCSKKRTPEVVPPPVAADTTSKTPPVITEPSVAGVPIDSSSVLGYLERAKIPYTGDPRRNKVPDFETGMAWYKENNFVAAQAELTKAVRVQSLDWELWLYLGSAAYLNGDTREAIHAFSMVEKYSAPAIPREQARWYVANAYIKGGRITRARRILQSLVISPGTYAGRADSLLSIVNRLGLADQSPLDPSEDH